MRLLLFKILSSKRNTETDWIRTPLLNPLKTQDKTKI